MFSKKKPVKKVAPRAPSISPHLRAVFDALGIDKPEVWLKAEPATLQAMITSIAERAQKFTQIELNKKAIFRPVQKELLREPIVIPSDPQEYIIIETRPGYDALPELKLEPMFKGVGNVANSDGYIKRCPKCNSLLRFGRCTYCG